MGKNNGTATDERFPLSTCRTLRNLVDIRKKLRADRDRAFENRDEARSRMDEADSEKQKKDATEDFGTCVRKIERLQVALKKLDNDIEEAIENPDQRDLWDDVGQLKLGDYLKDAPSKIAKAVEEREEAKKAEDVPPPPDGEDQHLAAAIQELGLSDKLTDALIQGNLLTVGALAAFQDKSDRDDEADDLQDLLNCTEAEQKAIVGALAKFRREHRKAAREAEGALA